MFRSESCPSGLQCSSRLTPLPPVHDHRRAGLFRDLHGQALFHQLLAGRYGRLPDVEVGDLVLRGGIEAAQPPGLLGPFAVVTAEGTTLGGKPRSLRIEMFREDGVWKVGAGIK